MKNKWTVPVLIVALGLVAILVIVNGGASGDPLATTQGSFARYLEGMKVYPLRETPESMDLGTILQLDDLGQTLHAEVDLAFEDSDSLKGAPWSMLVDEAVYHDRISFEAESSAQIPGLESNLGASAKGKDVRTLYTRVAGLERQELSTVALRNARLRAGIRADMEGVASLFVVQKVIRAKELTYVFSNESSALTEAELSGLISGEIQADGQSKGVLKLNSKIIAVKPAYIFGGEEVSPEEVELVARELSVSGIETSVEGGIMVAPVDLDNARLVERVATTTVDMDRLDRKAKVLVGENDQLTAAVELERGRVTAMKEQADRDKEDRLAAFADLHATMEGMNRDLKVAEQSVAQFKGREERLTAQLEAAKLATASGATQEAERLRALMKATRETVEHAYGSVIQEGLDSIYTAIGEKPGVGERLTQAGYLTRRDEWRSSLKIRLSNQNKATLELMTQVDRRIDELREFRSALDPR